MVVSNPNSELVNLLYGFLSDPEKFQNFVEELENRVADFPISSELDLKFNTQDGLLEIEHHFSLAASIFDKMAHNFQQNIPPSLTENEPSKITLDRHCRVKSINASAELELGLKTGDDLSEWQTNTEYGRTLAEETTRLKKTDPEAIIVILIPLQEGNIQQSLFTLSFTSPIREEDNHLFQLQTIGFGWNLQVGEHLRHSFGLTQAEQDILKGIVEGNDLAAIALNRGRSLQTIRTQAKSLLKKTGAKTQAGLIRLFVAISAVQSQAPNDKQLKKLSTAPCSGLIQAENGRQIDVEVWNPNGETALISLHGLFSGVKLTPQMQTAFAKNGYSYFAPWRAGWAATSRSEKDVLVQAADDVATILDHFQIKKAIILGRFTGSIYALSIADKLADRVQAVVNLSVPIPVQDTQQIMNMRGWQRIFAFAAVNTPSLIPILVRGMRQFLFRKETAKFMEGFYISPEADIIARQKKEVIEVIEEGVAKSFHQGTYGHETDLKLTASDWSPLLAEKPYPIHLIHGQQDPTSPIQEVRHLANQFPHLHVHEVEQAGQLYVHENPEPLIKVLNQIHKHT